MAGRFSFLPCAAFAVLALGTGRIGHAELDYRLWAGSSIGASDNPGAQANGSTGRFDGFASAQGRLQLGHIGQMTQEQVSYGIMGTAWFGERGSSSVTQTLRLSSLIQAGMDTRIALNAAATLARLSMVDTAATDPQAVGARPVGDQQFVAVDGGEELFWQPSATWRVDQSLQGRIYRSLGGDVGSTTNRSLLLVTQLTHLWQQDSAGLQGRVGAITSSRTASTGGPVATSRDSEFAEMLLSWKRDWNADIAHDVAAGVFVLRTDQARPLPAVSAGIQWRRVGREVELRGGQTAESNIYVGSAYQRRFVSLSLGLPLDRREFLRLAANANYEHDSTVGASEELRGSANVFSTRIGLSWQPGDTFVYGLNYTFRDQRATATDSGSSMFTTYRRQTAMFTVEAHYPSGL